MIPCMLCNDGSNAEFDGWEIAAEGTLEVLCARYICKSCGAPMWVQMAVRTADYFDDSENDGDYTGEDGTPADFSAGWEL